MGPADSISREISKPIAKKLWIMSTIWRNFKPGHQNSVQLGFEINNSGGVISTILWYPEPYYSLVVLMVQYSTTEDWNMSSSWWPQFRNLMCLFFPKKLSPVLGLGTNLCFWPGPATVIAGCNLWWWPFFSAQASAMSSQHWVSGYGRVQVFVGLWCSHLCSRPSQWQTSSGCLPLQTN